MGAEQLLYHHAVAAIMAGTAVPAGAVPTATALFVVAIYRADDFKPDAPWSAWLVFAFVVAMTLLANFTFVFAFYWLLRHVWRMRRDATWFDLGRTAWLALSAGCFAVGIGFGALVAHAAGAI